MPSSSSKRLVDVLDNFDVAGGRQLGKIYDKFVELTLRIESHNPSIDNFELRWVEHKIEQMEDGYTPTKNDLLQANLYWKKWGVAPSSK